MQNAKRSYPLWHFAFCILHFALLFVLSSVRFARAEVELPELSAVEPIVVEAAAGNHWPLGDYEVWILRGDCIIRQGDGVARSREAVLWIDRTETAERRRHKVIAYLEGDVDIAWDRRPNGPRLTDRKWIGRFFSSAGVEVRASATAGKPDVLPPIYWRGMEQRAPAAPVSPEGIARVAESPNSGDSREVRPVQFVAPASPGPSAAPPAAPFSGMEFVPGPAPEAPAAPSVLQPAAGAASILPAQVRRIELFARSDVPVQAQLLPDPTGTQSILTITSGVNVIVSTGAAAPGLGEVGKIDLSADRVVIWTRGLQGLDLNRPTVQDERTPLEFYLEGNVIFRQGERVIQADRMYYDVPNKLGTVLNADITTPLNDLQGLRLRLHAETLQQTAENRFFAQNAFITSSRMGEPGYRLQAGDVFFEDVQEPVLDPATGQPLVEPATREPIVEHRRLATAANNFVFIGPVPVFYWPMMATDLNDPTYYIRRARLRHDNVYGFQVLTDWNGYELLGIRNKPAGTDFGVSLDYLGERGCGHGGTFHYDRNGLFGFGERTAGLLDYWGIKDNGLDDLGEGRMGVPPEKSYRYRLFGQHRQLLPLDLQLSAEVGWISDRNFLEEYYKNEWEELKDESTGLELKHSAENRSWSVSADYRLNDFFTQSNWLPRGDHYWIGQSLFRDVLTWHEHSSAGYVQFRNTDVPDNATPYLGPPGLAGPFNYLPWEQMQPEGGRFATRQEIDWPFHLGAVKVVPYALGEAAHWTEDLAGDDLTRFFWQAGVRANLPVWSVDPTASNELLNVHGIAHKINFKAEFAYAQADKNLEDLPLYDPLDDDSIEAFRRRFMTTTFGVPSEITLQPWSPVGQILIPRQFDERLYALRSGLQSWVTSPSTEIAGDLTTIRLGAEQRWQTKRGPADNRRIIDWIALDTNITIFPDPDRDDFGSAAGLLDYDFRWHVGDRLTLVSDAIFDFFADGQKIVSVGGFLNRPPRGSLYAGFRIFEGPIHADILSLSYTYWMSPKWLSSFGTSIDLGGQGNIGQNFSVTRVGESFLISAGCNVDASRNSVGAFFCIEPRFLPKGRLGNIAGAKIPPTGANGLE